MADTTIAEELIGLIDTNNVPMYQAIKEIRAHIGSWVDKPMGLREFERKLGDRSIIELPDNRKYAII